MAFWTRREYITMGVMRDNSWLWAGTPKAQRVDPKTGKGARRTGRKAQVKPEKPESGRYWIITSVKDGKPYYLTEIEKRSTQLKSETKDITWTWKPGKEGMDAAKIFLNEDEAWETAYQCRGTVITRTAQRRGQKGEGHETDED